jgi:hypothetical protein
MRTEGLGHLKISKDFIGNRTRNLPSCGVVPHQTASPVAPFSDSTKPFKGCFERASFNQTTAEVLLNENIVLNFDVRPHLHIPRSKLADTYFHFVFILQELVASTPNQRNWRGILIALLVIVAVLGLIVFSIVLLSPPEEGPRVKGRKFTLDDVLGPHYRARRFNGTWVSGECALNVWIFINRIYTNISSFFFFSDYLLRLIFYR